MDKKMKGADAKSDSKIMKLMAPKSGKKMDKRMGTRK